MSLASSNIAQLRQRLLAKEITATDIVESVHQAIVDKNPSIEAYLSFDYEQALESSKSADLSLPLGGIPIAIKDNINVLGQPCTCASKILDKTYQSPYDATSIVKLKAAGGIPFGRVNMDEFAMGSSTENSAFGPSHNPWDLTRSPGGSSGGSSAAVAADIAIASLGSDTGGSIRQPASFCGIVGIKPTYGRISRYGLVAFASSLDQIGPVTKTVEDSAILLNALCGKDIRDATSLDVATPDFTAGLGQDIKGLRIGVPKEYLIDGIEPQIRQRFDEALKQYEALGAEIVPISLPNTESAIATYYIIAPAEASTNLSRFDGVRYGHRAENIKDLNEHYFKSRAEGFGPEVKRRILLGTYVLSSGYYDAYYLKAQKARTLIRQDFLNAFEQVDVIASPTSPEAPFQLGGGRDPLSTYLADIFTIPPNLAGLPAISVPCGFSEENGTKLPVGLQLVGKALDEVTLLKAAHAYEQSTAWHQAKP